MSSIKFRTPPIFEMGFTLRTAEAGLVDPYDIRSLHDVYRDELPKVERQLPLGSPDGAPIQVRSPDEDYQRWWFISEDGHSLAQFQANIIARNWRREVLPPDPGPDYPGYSVLAQQFRDQVSKHSAYLKSLGHPLVKPVSADIFFDNMIPYPSSTRLRDIVQPIQFDPPFQIVGFNSGWKESVDGAAPTEQTFLQVEMQSVGASRNNQPIRHFLRLRFIARHSVQSVDEALAFFDEAHTVVSKRLLDLTTPQCRATWGEL